MQLNLMWTQFTNVEYAVADLLRVTEELRSVFRIDTTQLKSWHGGIYLLANLVKATALVAKCNFDWIIIAQSRCKLTLSNSQCQEIPAICYFQETPMDFTPIDWLNNGVRCALQWSDDSNGRPETEPNVLLLHSLAQIKRLKTCRVVASVVQVIRVIRIIIHNYTVCSTC